MGFGQNNSGRSSATAVDINSGHFGRTVSVTNRPGNLLIPDTHLRLKIVDKSVLKESAELEKKKYLSYTYDLASVDNYDTKAYVRYNIFDDQMEFVKDESIYYLAKEVGRQVKFINTKDVYRVYEMKGELHFFKMYVSGENSLIAKQKIRYIDAKVATSGYDRARPANYKRLKDDIYLAKGNKELVELSGKKKKEFYKAFGDKEDQIKTYMKENKLGYKNVDDLEKIVTYYNSL
jgi:hypothetical protein